MNKLLAISIASASIAIRAIPALAEVDAKIHKLCIEAKDYVGCVKAMNGDLNPSSRLTKSPGETITEGNACPDGMAFAGEGTCKSVKCVPLTFQGEELTLKGKGWKCKRPFLQIAPNRPVWGDVSEPTYLKSECPMIKLKLGYNSTCDHVPIGWESPSAEAERKKREGPKCDFKLRKYDCSYEAYLDANPGMKRWAELNPEMATKERLKLKSID